MTNRPASIALVDIGYLFKKHWHLNDGSRNAAARGALRDLERLTSGAGAAQHLIACCDWGPYKRVEVYAEYKANRPEREPEELAQLKFLYEEMKRRRIGDKKTKEAGEGGVPIGAAQNTPNDMFGGEDLAIQRKRELEEARKVAHA